jgi:hypothetical protein
LPVLRNRIALEVARGVKAFLSVEADVTRGEVSRPESRPGTQKTFGVSGRIGTQVLKLRRIGGRVKQVGRRVVGAKWSPVARIRRNLRSIGSGGLNPENIVWIFGAGRTGSTWLARMMGELEGHTVWFEPRVGDLFDPTRLKVERRMGKHFILSAQYKKSWLKLIRAFILDGARARFPGLGGDDYLVIKEPSGSVAAPLLMETTPESRMILLVRDPRDVAASWIDAHRKGSWVTERKQGDSRPRRKGSPEKQLDDLVRRTSRRYLQNVGNALGAYEVYKGRKTLVRYEDLRADTLGTMRRIYSEIGIEVDEKELARAVEKYSWENVPQEKKGSGKFYRKAKPGGWREDLTPRQIRMVEKITEPVLKELYPA